MEYEIIRDVYHVEDYDDTSDNRLNSLSMYASGVLPEIGKGAASCFPVYRAILSAHRNNRRFPREINLHLTRYSEKF